jgi:hypothetical protein
MAEISRRDAFIGAAATVAAAASLAVAVAVAVAVADVASDEYGADAMEVLRRLWPEPWMPTTFYLRGDKVEARDKTYIATRNKVSPPFFTEHGFKQVESV